MSIIAQQNIQQDQIKLRWQEPYVSAALNNKTYKTMPRGLYRGFVIEPSGALGIKVGTGGTLVTAEFDSAVFAAVNDKITFSPQTVPASIQVGTIISTDSLLNPGPFSVRAVDPARTWIIVDDSLVDETASNVSLSSQGYQKGNYDAASYRGWSVAVHENHDGFSATIIMQHGVSSDYIFDLTSYVGLSVYAVLDVQYAMGFPTAGQVKIVDISELDSHPTLLVIGRIDVPSSGSIQSSHIVYNDALFPRVLPYANRYKAGFMSASQAEIVEILSNPAAVSPAFEVEYEVPADATPPSFVSIPGGNIYTVGGNDLFIFKNGIKMRRGVGRDYTEIDRGDGKGDQVQWEANLRAGDRITFRGQEYAVSLTNSLSVLDEGTQISSNVTRMNFVGNGVLVVPEGTGRVRVLIPAPPSSGAYASRTKLNATAFTIPQACVVMLVDDGTIAPFDPKVLTAKPFGITSGAIASGETGTVIVAGVVLNALIGIGGFITGSAVYVSSNGTGVLTALPPNPFVSSVWMIGHADCSDDAPPSSTPTDLVIKYQQLC